MEIFTGFQHWKIPNIHATITIMLNRKYFVVGGLQVYAVYAIINHRDIFFSKNFLLIQEQALVWNIP